MNHLKRNIIANFVGSGWTAIAGLVFVPFYIKFMGIAAYGLVGFFVTLQTVILLLDLGLSTTLNREMAKYSAISGSEQKARDMVRTLETIYWGIAIVLGLLMVLLAPLISTKWISSESLSADTVQNAVLLMGLSLALQFPFALYSGGLLGLQRQVSYNSIVIFTATVRGVGAILVLWLISPTIVAFFSWQIVVSILQTALGALLLNRALPNTGARARFRKYLLREIWRFTAGLSGIGILAVILTQMDKIVLSKMLPLETFGYYTLASVIASGFFVIIGPFFLAIFPRFSQLVAARAESQIKPLYHHGCQLMSVVLLSIAITAIFFSREIIFLWTRNADVAAQTYLLASMLITGTVLNGMYNLPYALQLAHGWTRLAFFQNLGAVILLFPGLLVATSIFGASGAAAVWIIVNASYVTIGIQFMHRRLLRKEKLRWYYQDVGLPLLGALSVGIVARLLFPANASNLVIMALIFLIFVATLTFSSLITPYTRNLISKISLPVIAFLKNAN